LVLKNGPRNWYLGQSLLGYRYVRLLLIKLADLPYNDLPLAVKVLNLDTRTYSEKLPVRLKSPPTFYRLGAEKRDTYALLMLREPFTTWSKGIFRLEKSPKEVSKERDLRLGRSIIAPGALSKTANSVVIVSIIVYF
jgi:hypothetical protein